MRRRGRAAANIARRYRRADGQGERGAAVADERSFFRDDRLEFPRPPSLGRDYWLARCEGYRVDVADGRLGTVEEVRFRARHDRPDSLAVRVGLFRTRLVLVPVEDVSEIVPREQRIRLSRSPLPVERGLVGDLLRALRRRTRGGVRAR